MKINYHLFLSVYIGVFILFINNIFAQSYIPFPKDSAYWIEDVSEQCDPYGIQLKHYEYSYSGDTIINLKSFKKIFLNGYGLCAWGGNVGALFDDTILRKVFFIPFPDSVEQILYDFTLNVGDTINGYFGGGAINTITSIDTVNFGGIDRKRFSYSGGFVDPYYIEGIGSATGLLENIDQYWINSSLLCFSVNGVAIYPITVSASACSLLSNSNNEKEDQFEFSVFPNPFSESVNFTFGEGKADQLILTDMTGIEWKKFYLKGNHFILNGNELSSGIYFYTLKKGNRVVWNGKLGVIH